MTQQPTGSLIYAAHLAATSARRAAVHDALAKTPPLSPNLIPDLGTVWDVAWANPTAAQVKAAGVSGVIGYFSHDTTKNLTPSQVSDYVLAGIGVCPIWETTAGRASSGYAAGQADARDAVTQRDACGLPARQLIRAAVDTDTTWAAVAAYFEGFASVIGKTQTAPYGGYRITTAAYAAGYRRCWQTLAWSAGQVDPHAVLYQNGHTALSGSADVNTILAPDWGQYPPLETDVNLSDRMPAYAAVKVPGKPDYIPTVGECISGARQADTKADALSVQASANGEALSALTLKVDHLAAAVAGIEALTLTPAQVSAIAAQVGPALADLLAARLAG